MKKKKRYSEGLCMSNLWALLEEEHGGCDQNTCDVSVAYRLGHIRWAVECFSNSGATSEEFDLWYERLPKVFKKRAEKERQALCEEEHLECKECNAVIWLPEEVDNYCDSCGNQLNPKTGKKLKAS